MQNYFSARGRRDAAFDHNDWRCAAMAEALAHDTVLDASLSHPVCLPLA
jgi:hypothetical protein